MGNFFAELRRRQIYGVAAVRKLTTFWVLLGLATLALDAARATEAPRMADFSPSPDVGWIAYGPEFIPAPNEARPVASDPGHPWVPNAVEYFFGRPDPSVGDQPTYPIADLTNPILRPVTRAALANLKADILAGKAIDNRQASCWPLGVPGFLLHPVSPNYFVQGVKEVLMISQGDQMVRHVHLNALHAARIKPSWFGDSIGHYEGDSLVVDTVGLNTKAFIDHFRTPHSEKLHVVERFHLIDGGKTMEANIHIEDPDAFTTPWNAIQRFARVERGSLQEQVCAENNVNYFHRDVEPMPQADKPEF